MKRYYDKLTHTEVRTPSEHTVEYGTGIIDWWFAPLAPGEKILYWTDDMPYKYTEDFMKPIVEDGEVIEGITQEELDEIARKEAEQIIKSMNKNGTTLYADNKNRIEVGADHIIEDQTEFNEWMNDVYNTVDGNAEILPKPPATERQKMQIALEDEDNYEFTRYQDEWGWRWYLRLQRDTVNALAIAIYDANGNYLYTTGALLAHPDGGWYTECPAGQADATKKDVYYKWLLGSVGISGLECYCAAEEKRDGIVRSDERYDMEQS